MARPAEIDPRVCTFSFTIQSRVCVNLSLNTLHLNVLPRIDLQAGGNWYKHISAACNLNFDHLLRSAQAGLLQAPIEEHALTDGGPSTPDLRLTAPVDVQAPLVAGIGKDQIAVMSLTVILPPTLMMIVWLFPARKDRCVNSKTCSLFFLTTF